MNFIPTAVRNVEAQLNSAVVGEVQTLAVITPGEEPISLAQAKAHLRQYFDDEDDYISGLIVAARQMAEGRLNRSLVPQTRTATFDAADRCYTLRKPPLISVDAVYTVDEDGLQTAIDSADYRTTYAIDPPKLKPTSTARWHTAVNSGETLVVEYTAGYNPGEVPTPIIQWMLAVIGTMYAQRESIVVGVSVSSVPNEFLNLQLQPYMVYE